MTEVLSQDEIDQLLQAINSGDQDTNASFKPVSDTRKIKIYDFKRPDKFSNETEEGKAYNRRVDLIILDEGHF